MLLIRTCSMIISDGRRKGARWQSGLERWLALATGQFPARFESHCGKLRFGTLVAIPFTPLSQSISEETLNSVGPFYSCVYARGSKRFHQSALECVTVVDYTTHYNPPPPVRQLWHWRIALYRKLPIITQYKTCPQATACSDHVQPILEALMDIWALFLHISNLLQIRLGRFGVHVVARGGQVGKHVVDGLHVECPVSSALYHNVLAQGIYHTNVLNPE